MVTDRPKQPRRKPRGTVAPDTGRIIRPPDVPLTDTHGSAEPVSNLDAHIDNDAVTVTSLPQSPVEVVREEALASEPPASALSSMSGAEATIQHTEDRSVHDGNNDGDSGSEVGSGEPVDQAHTASPANTAHETYSGDRSARLPVAVTGPGRSRQAHRTPRHVPEAVEGLDQMLDDVVAETSYYLPTVLIQHVQARTTRAKQEAGTGRGPSQVEVVLSVVERFVAMGEEPVRMWLDRVPSNTLTFTQPVGGGLFMKPTQTVVEPSKGLKLRTRAQHVRVLVALANEYGVSRSSLVHAALLWDQGLRTT